MQDANTVTLSLDLTNPQELGLFPLIFAYNHVCTEVARAVRIGDTGSLVDLQVPLQALRRELERRGVLGSFLKLKGIESQRLLEQFDVTEGGPDERDLN